MKLIIKEYLASLKERGELDALLPDLLSQMGLNVISRPGIGPRQYGVDIAAVGKLDNEPEKVYLFSVKAGDLGRQDWNSGSLQDLQPSLDEILTVYIPTHLPSEHRNKPIEICICTGGEVKEAVRLNITQYIKAHKTDTINFVEWMGDHLATMIEKHFLQEDLLPKDMRPSLRKALALIDEPQASFSHFSKMVRNLSSEDLTKDSKQRLTSMRQMHICLWILFAWAREAGNMESAYLSAELTLLHAWELNKKYFKKRSKIAKALRLTFSAIINTYSIISSQYLLKNILPHTNKLHGLSTAIHPSDKLDVNLRMFDVLGRLALAGIWSHFGFDSYRDNTEIQDQYYREINLLSNSLKQLIVNNPTLFLPIKDEQVIDISLALLFLSFRDGNEKDMIGWLTEIIDRAIYSYDSHGSYPCIHSSYIDLLDHPKSGDEEYRKEATAASVLYPTIALWAAFLKDNELLKKVQIVKENKLAHCNFQFWYIGELTEVHLYKNTAIHGATLSHVPIDQTATDFLKVVWDECDHSDTFNKLSCAKNGLWPLILVACRHYRLPVPIDFTLGYREQKKEDDSVKGGEDKG